MTVVDIGTVGRLGEYVSPFTIHASNVKVGDLVLVAATFDGYSNLSVRSVVSVSTPYDGQVSLTFVVLTILDKQRYLDDVHSLANMHNEQFHRRAEIEAWFSSPIFSSTKGKYHDNN